MAKSLVCLLDVVLHRICNDTNPCPPPWALVVMKPSFFALQCYGISDTNVVAGVFLWRDNGGRVV